MSLKSQTNFGVKPHSQTKGEANLQESEEILRKAKDFFI